MGGKDSSLSSARAHREAGGTIPGTPRSASTAPFYRQFLPGQLASSSSTDSIPSLDDLSNLARSLGRIRSENAARLVRLDARADDPLRPIFSSSAHDLFAPPGLSPTAAAPSASATASLYSDSSSRAGASATKYKSKERAFNLASPEPLAASPSAHASPSNPAATQRHRIKIKRERDGESLPHTVGPSNGLYADGRKDAPTVGGKAGTAAGSRAKHGRGQSAALDDDDSVAGTDPDWDLDEDSLPSRPGRTRQKKRRRKESGLDSFEDDSGSDFESAALAAGSAGRIAAAHSKTGTPAVAAARLGGGSSGQAGSASRRGSEVGGGSSSAAAAAAASAGTPKSSGGGFGMRLKLNPAGNSVAGAAASVAASATASPAIQRKDSETTAASTRRNSIMPTPSPHPSTPQPAALHTLPPSSLANSAAMLPPVSAGPAPGWELPARTPQSYMPVLPASRLPRPYPTHPSEVNEDFANKDWKERERERDRLIERESAQPGTPGVGPGASLVKEATTGRRGGRDQQQTPITTFYNYADAFFKTLTEDDLAWLSSKSDDNEPFQMPALGRHYKKVWEEEDALAASTALDLYGTPFSGSAPGHSRTPSISLGAPGTGLPVDLAALSHDAGGKAGGGDANGKVDLDIAPPAHFKAKQMSDEHLGLGSEAVTEARSGPLTERLVSAFLPKGRGGDSIPGAESGASSALANDIARPSYDGDDDDEGGDEDAEGELDTAYEGLLHDQDMVEFEERIKRELKAIDVLGADEEVDWSRRADDEISTTLRMVQRALARQQKINGMRKARLFQIAVDRMAYQDYVICLNTVEKEIEAGWNKRLRQIKTSLGKRKKGSGGGGASASHHQQDDGGGGANGAALSQSQGFNGLGPGSGDAQSSQSAANYNGPVRPQLPEALTAAMERRSKLEYAFGQMFDEARHAWETPTESVYADLDLDNVE
ncbi:uncharacterized protein PFL1_05058 [Pseudozyma flocculosa PF-1]|uniref:Uncharacterized protein n=2 Tax=Pseudozyma flocculosa TaxID=84751 RepID=A0A5C3EWR7_9BASI|nr:uncharacterized protein PFL1_05058 [Pseudozyma flocculosa PF-1]EPQ27520.1 hypothetical protein PFL1_05058 [Pseudozyma flocculosa PF-1]SPO36046.1 uncharacterized protein PSFLO_01517 [Pseudozyma flocculosa]